MFGLACRRIGQFISDFAKTHLPVAEAHPRTFFDAHQPSLPGFAPAAQVGDRAGLPVYNMYQRFAETLLLKPDHAFAQLVQMGLGRCDSTPFDDKTPAAVTRSCAGATKGAPSRS